MRRDRTQSFLIGCALAVHLLFLLIILVSPSFAFRKKEKKPLIVKTIVPKPAGKTTPVQKMPAPSKQVAKVTPTPAPKQTTALAPPPTPTPAKKETVKPTPKPAAVAKKEPAIADKKIGKVKATSPVKKQEAPKNRGNISDALVKELEESIAKLENTGKEKKTTPASKATPAIVLQIDTADAEVIGEEPSDYTDKLIGHLHGALRLPEYGEVQMQLRLRQDGTVVKLVVLKTQSEKNKHYLETHLPHLSFPRFEGVYASKKEFTFILTFCNE